jgi:predicted DNA-binding WGR domain protein
MARRETTGTRSKAPAYEEQRHLEKVEGGSTLFYEVSRQGKWVMLRTGHVGLPGQTRMREYPTDPSASTAMERMVEDRLKEGWTEGKLPLPSAPPPAADDEASEEPRRRARKRATKKERPPGA